MINIQVIRVGLVSRGTGHQITSKRLTKTHVNGSGSQIKTSLKSSRRYGRLALMKKEAVAHNYVRVATPSAVHVYQLDQQTVVTDLDWMRPRRCKSRLPPAAVREFLLQVDR